MSESPEILAPAGDRRSLLAALHAGANAVYLGVSEGWNARSRAANFALAELPGTAALVHRAGARIYLALNTLVFDDELPAVEEVLRQAAVAGVDAVIVQDVAVALLARAVCPSLPLHASTQMTIASADAVRFAAALGCRRVILPRELAVAQVGALVSEGVELEVFVHGALCMSWSGQCLASLEFGGRSANRGRCAHPCRLPYRPVVDGSPVTARGGADAVRLVRHPLSARDLAGERAVAALVDAGVVAMKIEGRQKGPAYVTTAVRSVRAACDPGAPDLASRLGACAAVFSRGFCAGFLDGPDHQRLVEGVSPGHLGAPLGHVVAARPPGVLVVEPVVGAEPSGLSPPVPRIELRAGMGIAVGLGERATGGPLHGFERRGGHLVLRFGRPGPDLDLVSEGDPVFVNGDPALEREAEALTRGGPPEGRIALDLHVSGAEGRCLRVDARAAGRIATVASVTPLAAARGRGLDAADLRDKLGGLGGTPFRLRELELALDGAVHLPVSELKTMRRALVESLTAAVERGSDRLVRCEPVLLELDRAPVPAALDAPPRLVALCRTLEHVNSAAEAGVLEVELETRSVARRDEMVALARRRGMAVCLVTLRVDSPAGVDDPPLVRRLRPDGVVVRSAGALQRLAALRAEAPWLKLHGDGSLNATNRLSARFFLSAGLDTVTPAPDLDGQQLAALCRVLPRGRAAVTVHARMPLFHTAHCVFAHILGIGHTSQDCGRPCDRHVVALEDRLGERHLLRADAACRNTVFASRPRQVQALVPALVEAGVGRFRVELLDENAAAAVTLLERWRDVVQAAASR